MTLHDTVRRCPGLLPGMPAILKPGYRGESYQRHRLQTHGKIAAPPSPRPPSRGPASVLAAASAVDPVLHRLRRHQQPWIGPGSGAGATVGVASSSVPVNDRWYQPPAPAAGRRTGQEVQRLQSRLSRKRVFRQDCGLSCSLSSRHARFIRAQLLRSRMISCRSRCGIAAAPGIFAAGRSERRRRPLQADAQAGENRGLGVPAASWPGSRLSTAPIRQAAPGAHGSVQSMPKSIWRPDGSRPTGARSRRTAPSGVRPTGSERSRCPLSTLSGCCSENLSVPLPNRRAAQFARHVEAPPAGLEARLRADEIEAGREGAERAFRAGAEERLRLRHRRPARPGRPRRPEVWRTYGKPSVAA